MSTQLILSLSIALYLLAAWQLWKDTRQQLPLQNNEDSRSPKAKNSLTTYVYSVIAVAAHITYFVLFSEIEAANNATSPQSFTLNLNLNTMSVLISSVVVIIFLLGCTALPISRLGILVYPLTAVSLVFSYLWQPDLGAVSQRVLFPISAFSLHIIIALLAYALLAIAAIQALLYLYQEKQIKNRTAPHMLLILPPLQTMEKLLFRLSAMAFVLLSLTLLSGALFSQQIFGQAFAFKHHTILALFAWGALATMMVMHFRTGLRASQTAAWVLCSFALVQLGYFGTKIITETLTLN